VTVFADPFLEMEQAEADQAAADAKKVGSRVAWTVKYWMSAAQWWDNMMHTSACSSVELL
jgi:hypothetical protein